jgi:hypothetical protein
MNEITDEHRAAWQRLSNGPGFVLKPGITVEDDAALIAPLLPPDLLDPQPVLPTEPGWYASEQDPTIAVFLDINTIWWYGADEWDESDVVSHLPFTRLAPERPQITREQVSRAVADVAQQLGVPAHTSTYVSALTAALVNGTDRD